MTTKKLREVMRKLRKRVPTDKPIRVIRRPYPVEINEFMGYCIEGRPGYRVIVNSNLSPEMQVETLLHEYAHALCWPGQLEVGRIEAHDSLWGIAYARTFRAYYEEISRKERNY